MPKPPSLLPSKPSALFSPLLLCRRCFHDYFVTHLPSSSLHPDSRSSTGPHHKLPRSASTPHRDDDDNSNNADASASSSSSSSNGTTSPTRRSPAALPFSPSREMTVVRIPLRSAKHHFGSCVSRGTRPYNEDAFQAGTIEVPAFAKRRPISLTTTSRRPAGAVASGEGEGTSADGASGDPQVFYFGVFDGHGGRECAEFLRERLHEYVEEGTVAFRLRSSLKKEFPGQGKYARRRSVVGPSRETGRQGEREGSEMAEAGKESLDAVEVRKQDGGEKVRADGERIPSAKESGEPPPEGADPVLQSDENGNAEQLEKELIQEWRNTVGGYFKRFKPEYFSVKAGGQGHVLEQDGVQSRHTNPSAESVGGIGMETVLTYAFLKADLDFIEAQASKKDEEDPVLADRALNADDVLEYPSRRLKSIGDPNKRFKGGSTGSVALISTPTPTPFWHPASPSTLIVSHAGDTRIILCNTANGQAVPLTNNHHPSTPIEATRLRRYAATFVTDSFGEERMSGLANTRAFGDMSRKRLGISAEPEVRRVELSPAEYSFLVLCSDGVSGTLSDQEIVDIVKEAKTPEQGARDVVGFATEVSGGGGGGDADNATALVVRLGGWERRSEGGLGSLGTKEAREWRRRDAMDPRSRRT
ncbi:protein serine/threonine phosphatase 2C [Viridothelium virens]|uniref:Protein serine/threonine phosphatase 2C n=1 Tax=Viridothelium virens TaxID=1048519 RepID=A0A6A6GX51_VIRVR|nr:protein serine/threonine phosphatase 2C [Viridothelium virens]